MGANTSTSSVRLFGTTRLTICATSLNSIFHNFLFVTQRTLALKLKSSLEESLTEDIPIIPVHIVHIKVKRGVGGGGGG